MLDQTEDWYDTATICRNGHVINAYSRSQPDSEQAFCDMCGAATLTVCTNCGATIRGYHHTGVFSMRPFEAPGYCYQCGKPYPWIADRLDAARQLAYELDNLTSEQQNILDHSLDDLVRDTSHTTVAAIRTKKLLIRAGQSGVDAFREILIDVLSETAKKVIFPHG